MARSKQTGLDGAIIPMPVQQTLELFKSALAEVKFPDVDSKALQQLADAVHRESEQVKADREALRQAENKLEEQRGALLQKAHQALAYARIFAGQDDGLLRSIDAIRLPKVKAPKAGDNGAQKKNKASKGRKGGAAGEAKTKAKTKPNGPQETLTESAPEREAEGSQASA